MGKKKSFEQAMQSLEDIVKEMESGELALEEAVKKYEQGIKHSKYCLDILDKTEGKISLLSQDENGTLKEDLFEDR
jgi:exodeoxyribonuclease VII small subunit